MKTMRRMLLPALAVFEAAVIAALALHIAVQGEGETLPPAPAPSTAAPAGEDEAPAGAPADLDVLLAPEQTDPATPLAVEVPPLEHGELPCGAGAEDSEIVLDCLARRLEAAGIRLSRSAMRRVCERFGSGNRHSDGDLNWVQHGDYAVLAVRHPTAFGQADSCLIFARGRFKGSLDVGGTIAPDDCLAILGDDLWLTVSVWGRGTGSFFENVYWYRLNASNLFCELQYQASWHDSPMMGYCTSARQTVTSLTTSGSGQPVVTIASVVTVQDEQDDPAYQLVYEDERTYLVDALSDRINPLAGAGRHILRDNREQILELLQSGTERQKRSLHSLLGSWVIPEEIHTDEELAALYRIYQDWYEQGSPQESP